MKKILLLLGSLVAALGLVFGTALPAQANPKSNIDLSYSIVNGDAWYLVENNSAAPQDVYVEYNDESGQVWYTATVTIPAGSTLEINDNDIIAGNGVQLYATLWSVDGDVSTAKRYETVRVSGSR